ncbi:MAG: hypothetical protein EZS28_026998 [Streblomastix strix]|uniref:DDE-1 domain-containing protein n=1 Tax=Streblomastix strix TaxID=222440 RepID=A0A5J4V3H1_9EUKA|nr:MAG: hypothetical protein EZS28_026998 [Streblomastix strix]
MEEEEIYIFINDSGFMTCRLFRQYAKLQLTCFIIGYFTSNERIILLLDGHPSRKDWKSARILAEENIVAVTFPGGLAPILQPIDVCINRPFHQAYVELYRQKSKQKRIELNKPTLKAAQKRLIIIQCSNEAFQKVAITTIKKSSFKCTGTCPRNINRMLSNSFIVNDDKSPLYPNGRLYGHESEHETLRANACQYIVDNAEQFSRAFVSAEDYQALALKKKEKKKNLGRKRLRDNRCLY